MKLLFFVLTSLVSSTLLANQTVFIDPADSLYLKHIESFKSAIGEAEQEKMLDLLLNQDEFETTHIGYTALTKQIELNSISKSVVERLLLQFSSNSIFKTNNNETNWPVFNSEQLLLKLFTSKNDFNDLFDKTLEMTFDDEKVKNSLGYSVVYKVLSDKKDNSKTLKFLLKKLNSKKREDILLASFYLERMSPIRTNRLEWSAARKLVGTSDKELIISLTNLLVTVKPKNDITIQLLTGKFKGTNNEHLKTNLSRLLSSTPKKSRLFAKTLAENFASSEYYTFFYAANYFIKQPNLPSNIQYSIARSWIKFSKSKSSKLESYQIHPYVANIFNSQQKIDIRTLKLLLRNYETLRGQFRVYLGATLLNHKNNNKFDKTSLQLVRSSAAKALKNYRYPEPELSSQYLSYAKSLLAGLSANDEEALSILTSYIFDKKMYERDFSEHSGNYTASICLIREMLTEEKNVPKLRSLFEKHGYNANGMYNKLLFSEITWNGYNSGILSQSVCKSAINQQQ